MTGVDKFAVQLVLDGTPMDVTGVDLDAAVMALVDRGHPYATIAHRCRITERKVQKVVDAVRARARRAA